MTTIEEIRNMSVEETEAFQKEVNKAILKRAALKVTMTTAVLIACHYIAKKIEENQS